MDKVEKRDVFISYHMDTAIEIVQLIVNALEQNGISCWYSPRDCSGDYASAIIEALGKADIFLFILEEKSTYSEDCKNEIFAAFKRFKANTMCLSIFQIESHPRVSDDYIYYLGRMHAINGTIPPVENRVEELVMRLKHIKQTIKTGFMEELSLESRLVSSSINPSLDFVGRVKEKNEIHEYLKDNKLIFVVGMGGIGKSELVRSYISNHESEYRTRIWGTFENSIKSFICNDDYIHITNFERIPIDESDDSYYQRKYKFLKETVSQEDLLVIDNYDVDNDPNFKDLSDLNMKIIITSRKNSDNFKNITVLPLEDEKELFELFIKGYPRKISEDEYQIIMKIIERLNGHTLSIKLVAKLMKEQRISAANMLEKIENSFVETLDQAQDSQKHINNQVSRLFEMSNMSPKKKHILINLSLIPYCGISAQQFYEILDLDSYEDIDQLINDNWVLHNVAEDEISLHTIISHLALRNIKYSDEECHKLLEYTIEKLSSFKKVVASERPFLLSLMERIIKYLPDYSKYFDDFYMACGVACHTSAKHNRTIEILNKFLEHDISPLEKVQGLIEIADAYRCMHKASELLDYSEQAHEIIKNLDLNDEKVQKAFSLLMGRYGFYYEMIGEYEKSLESFNKQLEIVKKFGDETSIDLGWAYYNIGIPMLRLKRYDESIEYFVKADKFFENIDFSYGAACSKKSTAVVYFEKGEYQKSLEIDKEALNLFMIIDGEKHNDTIACHFLLSKIYFAQGLIKESEEEYNYSIREMNSLGYINIVKMWEEEFNKLKQ